MKKLMLGIVFGLLPVSVSAIEEGTFYPAPNQTEACGVVVQAKAFAKGVFLNLGRPYPNQEMTIVLWNIPLSDVPSLYGKRVCALGKPSEYKGKPRVEIQSLKQLTTSE